MARRLQADRPSHRPLAPAGDRLADRLGRKQQQRGSQHRHPLDRGHPVGGRAASTSSQVDHPSSARNSTATTPPAGDWLPGRGRAATSRCCDPQRALAIWASTMAANTIVDKVASAGPPAGRAPPDASRATAPGRPAPWPARRPRPPGRGTRRREPGRPRPASEPTGSAVAAPSPPARVARRQGPAAAAGRYRCPGRGSAAPTGPGGSVRGQRPWEPHLEDGDPRTWAVSLWPTRIRQRMGVGWEARVLM